MNTDLDFYTDVINHCTRVSKLVSAVCDEIGEVDMKSSLQEAAELHDIGKFYVKHSILCVKRKLNPLERYVVDMHTLYGYLACKQLGCSPEVSQLVLLHHGKEKFFISKEDILPSVERVYPILWACDIWDALRSPRVYKPVLNRKESLEILFGYKDIPIEICNALYKFSERC